MKDGTEKQERKMVCGIKCEFEKRARIKDDIEEVEKQNICGFDRKLDKVARRNDATRELENQINFGLEINYEEKTSKNQIGKGLKHPVLAKLLSRSHVSSGFLLHLNTPFCKRHLPGSDTVMLLEIETGERYEAKYLPRLHALSGGWRRFAICMELKEGDLVAFELVEAKRFKVYIIRKKSTINLPTLLNLLHAQDIPNAADCKEPIVYKRSKGRLLGSRSTAKRIPFSNITGFQDFKTVMSKQLEDHELPENTLQTYYKLCTKQNDFLHAHLLTETNPRLLAESVKRVIIQTVNIACALDTCDLTKFLENYTDWDQTLMQFDTAGMNLSFLHARLHQLHAIAFSSEAVADRGRYIEACRERARVDFEVKKLEWALGRLKDASSEFDSEVVTLASVRGRENHMEPHLKLARCKDEIFSTEILIDEFGKMFDHYDARIESLKTKTNKHEIQFQEEVSKQW